MARAGPAGCGSILFRSDDASVVLLDIPRSLEEGQVLPGQAPVRRIFAGPPPSRPLPTPEPKDATARPQKPPAAHIADLMTAAAVRGALQRLASQYAGPFHGPRLVPRADRRVPCEPASSPFVPPDAHPLQGSIQATRQTLLDTAPAFDLMVLDPPWPNRSARRRTDKYATAAGLAETRQLLADIPVPALLAPGGLVAVWTTNKPAVAQLLTSPTGVFASWGLELATEWTWVKITSSGEPLYDLDSCWRKPWEKLLIARPRGCSRTLESRVVVAAPDIHSRKPNLRLLFQDVLGQDYTGLEVFARNLTAGWWSWGDEVLKFQEAQYWQGVADDAVDECVCTLDEE